MLFSDFQAVTEIDLSNADTSNVVTMNAMFCQCYKLQTINLSGFDTRNVKDMGIMFFRCNNLITVDLSGFDTKNVTKMYSMFSRCTKLESVDLSNFDTTNVKALPDLFESCGSLKTVDLSSFDTSNVTDMKGMFDNCISLETILVSEKWTTPANPVIMFDDCKKIVGGKGTVFSSDIEDSTYAHIDGGESNPGYFTYKPFWKTLPFDENTGTLTLTGEVVKEQLDEYRADPKVKHIVADSTVTLPDSCKNFFTGMMAEDIDLSAVDCDNVKDIYNMISYCQNLKTVDLGGIDLSSIEHANYAFYWNPKLETIYVYSGGIMSYIEDDEDTKMFEGCTSLKGYAGTVYDSNYVGKSRARVDEGASNPGYFSVYIDGVKYQNGVLTITNVFDKNTFKDTEYANAKKVIVRGDALPEYSGELFSQFPNVEEIDLSGADFSHVTYMRGWFRGLTELYSVEWGDHVETGNVENMQNLFNGCTSLQFPHVEALDTSGINSAYAMFRNCSSLESVWLNLNNFDTSNIVSFSQMFDGCSMLTSINLSSFDTSSLTDTRYMFRNCFALKRITVSDKWVNNDRFLSDGGMFTGCTSLVGGNGTAFDPSIINSSYARIDMPGTPGYFRKRCCSYDPETNTLTLSGLIDRQELYEYTTENVHNAHAVYIVADETAILPENCTNLFSDLRYTRHIDLSKADPSNVKVVRCMFEGSGAEDIQLPDNLVTNKINNLNGMFKDCKNLKSIDVSGFDTSNVNEMRLVFSGCESLTSLDVSGFDTSKVNNMQSMFYGCSSLSSLDLSGFDTSKVFNMSAMFRDCELLASLDVSSFDTSNVEYMFHIFENCKSLTSLDLSNFDTSKVFSMNSMFLGCESLTSLDLSSFDTSNVNNMSSMFIACKSLTSLDVSSFDTSKVTNMSYMFNACKSLTALDLSSFDTSQNVEIDEMFNFCDDLETILVSDKWDPYAVSAADGFFGVFFNCDNLKGGNGTVYNADHRYSDYARIDKSGAPGYFAENTLYNVEFKHNCSFQNDLSMYYAVPKSSLSGYSNIRLDVSKEEYAAGAEKPTFAKKTLTSYKEQTINGVVYYMFTFDGITSTDMGSTLSAVLRADKNGVTYSTKPDKYSIKDYAMDRLQNSNNSSFKKMLVDMLNYGAAAQLHFDKNTSNLVNKDLTAA
ncbi:BspA family leucine-rich repeat surface protein, partial [Ruminococcus sp.]|uniref:BspA family leucine-rich repeat surface protein n=1 Tax=Ruminococcus sp. TaxID=41978 RepID=UPI002D1482A8